MDMVTLAAAKQYTKRTAEGMGALVGPEGPPGPPGVDGAQGPPGESGVSPTVTVRDIPGGHQVTITDVHGPAVFDVMDGKDGEGGGAAGVESFNGRTGPVTPQEGDYTPQMVGAVSDDEMKAALSKKQDALTPDGSIRIQGGEIGVALPAKPISKPAYDALPEEERQKERLYLVEGAAPGDGGSPVPTGAVVSFLGRTAPEGYLVCDGAEHPVRSYPGLSAYFASQFGAANCFGGDGETTFAVPDMRNLFLRGYHGEAEEQISGEVGEKQEATQIANTFSGTNSSGKAVFFWTCVNGANAVTKNSGFDTEEYLPNSHLSAVVDIGGVSGHYPNRITTRPVNMAVLYCIKT